MNTGLHIEVALPGRTPAEDIAQCYALMINAYSRTEAEIWGENYVRMPWSEYAELLEKGEVLLARIEGKVVGTIWVHRIDTERYGFGLLAADPRFKGAGIGRALIQAAETFALAQGVDRMSIEILRPAAFELPFKTVLADWYSRLGYRKVATMTFLELRSEKVEKAKMLKVPAVFDVYEKSLG